jgi:hypothetical protein
MKNRFLFLFLFSSLFMASCDSDETNTTDSDKVETKDITRDGSIETLLTTIHLDDSRDVLTTTHKVWKAGVLINTIMHNDTLPALGIGEQKAADEKGEATTATGKKDYEFYITVK